MEEMGVAFPVECSGGLTCAGFKGWHHGHKHIVKEKRATIHPDGAGQ